MTSSTIFSEIVFDEGQHVYSLNGQPLRPVTSFIGQFRKPFDIEYWSTRKAAEQGVPVETILQEWEDKRLAGLERGTAVHRHIERVLRGKGEVCGPWPYLEMRAFDDFWLGHRAAWLKPKKIEWVIGDAVLGLAGTVDCLMLSQIDREFHIFDWKTGSKFTTENTFSRLLPPFDHLDESDLNAYSLQVSLYRLIIERNTDLKLGESHILHLGKDGKYHLYTALDLRSELESAIEAGY